MSQQPPDEDPRQSDDEPVAAWSIDVGYCRYGIAARGPLGELDKEETVSFAPPAVRPWKDIVRDCVASLQQFLVRTSQLPAELAETAIRVIRNSGRLSGSLADLAQRLGRGRSRVDSSEDQKIAEQAEQRALPEPQQNQSLAEAALDRHREQLERLRSAGVRVREVQLPTGEIVILLVDEPLQRQVLQQAQAQLLRLPAPETPSAPAKEIKLRRETCEVLRYHKITSLKQLKALTRAEAAKLEGMTDKILAEIARYLK